MLTNKKIQEIEQMCHRMRIDSLNMALTSGARGAHLSGSLSCMEIYATLYKLVLRYDLNNPAWDSRDRFIAGKEHARLAEFPAMAECGFFPKEELLKFEANDGLLSGHPVNHNIGLEYSSCSLGMALPFAVGKAIQGKISGKDYRIFTLVGDAECDEGSVWEAFMCAAQYKLDNLTIIIDRNYLSVDGNTEDLMAQRDMAQKLNAFGLETVDVDGHNVEQLYEALQAKTEDKPRVIVAHTIKGKGISFIENNKDWHQAVLSVANYERAMDELKGLSYGSK